MIKGKHIFYRIYEWVLMSATLVFLLFIYIEVPLPTEYYPIYEDTINAIKAADPLEQFKDSDSYKDFVNL